MQPLPSRALVSADHTVSFPLNISESRRTATGRFVGALSGGGVHHIAFTSADLVQTAAQLRAAGAHLLDIPENYYVDLDARLLLSADTLATLQHNDLLYDEDAYGQFRQVYTATFDERFFFVTAQHEKSSLGRTPRKTSTKPSQTDRPCL
ncbi:Hemolysin-like protein, 4-hydroxyphenylpyruvate dioxygenase related protein (plasmid) [Deinococcus geothermalis DSM 11300]|uniref:Hemolysin-like protein, 4-hydroxyphenylpyruvate dioxygenase related protein n=1 Tax=Deinococcus geothermalis (strain DSM 11300 / CIP 105573 / AG-3a) TaxID=319795 RepID=Q1J3W5_DEIGD|nr:4-hydroxyphenylpyruvate dioxygenase [Deinococcus geothermalis]ABF43813.1 Hemolysin-like protein, 4-hydroxyphenylpyruvate dioxygenase related protein [Deinococcus geothermalis DSM 11300]